MDVPLNYIPGSITKEKTFGMTKVKEKYNMVFIQKVLKHLEGAVGGYYGKINLTNYILQHYYMGNIIHNCFISSFNNIILSI